MAAIEPRGNVTSRWGALLSAALAIPSLAVAQESSEGLLSIRWLSYQDAQPGFERVRVDAPAVLLRTPAAGKWQFEATVVNDAVSGASPRYHSSISGASKLSDVRRAGDLKVTHIEDSESWAIGISVSDENDFHSRAISGQGSWISEDKNTTLNTSLALTYDRIGSVDILSLNEMRNTVEWTGALTQAISTKDLLQLSLAVSYGRGYYSDPYKGPDNRPDFRRQHSATVRWNHHVEDWDTTFRSSYRLYLDSFGVRSHTLGLETIIPLGLKWKLSPAMRLYTQDAASFYYDPVFVSVGTPYPSGYFDGPPAYISADHRLSAFGAVTLGLKVELRLSSAWTTDFKLERYEQRNEWHFLTPGSRGVATLTANIVQWGLTHRF